MRFLTLEEIQYKELEMLKWLSDICLDNNLLLYLAYGTMLGAVRHKGFIPWDDDVDVMLPRYDYDKLIVILNKMFDHKYQICSYDDNKVPLPYAKLLDKTTFILNENNVANLPANLWIDIFPVDGFPDSFIASRVSLLYSKFLRKVLRIATSNFSDSENCFKKLSKIFLFIPSRMIGPSRLRKAIDKHSKKILFSSANKVGVIFSGRLCESMDKKRWLQSEHVHFCDYSFDIPGCWDNYLKGFYGNYMILPPENNRHKHNIKVFVE